MKAAIDHYRFGYVYRQYFSSPASVQIHSSAGEPSDTNWGCQNEAENIPGHCFNGYGMDKTLPKLKDEEYCYLTTIGRVTGKPHEIEIWFGLNDKTHLYPLRRHGQIRLGKKPAQEPISDRKDRKTYIQCHGTCRDR